LPKAIKAIAKEMQIGKSSASTPTLLNKNWREKYNVVSSNIKALRNPSNLKIKDID